MADLLNLGSAGKKPLKDQVTPYKMSLLVLVSNYCRHTSQLREQILEDTDNIYSEHEEREIMFTILQLLQVFIPIFHWVFFILPLRISLTRSLRTERSI